jgi:hypothetical protein
VEQRHITLALSPEISHSGLLEEPSAFMGKAAAELFTNSDVRAELETSWRSIESYSAYMSVGRKDKKALVC